MPLVAYCYHSVGAATKRTPLQLGAEASVRIGRCRSELWAKLTGRSKCAARSTELLLRKFLKALSSESLITASKNLARSRHAAAGEHGGLPGLQKGLKARLRRALGSPHR